MPVSAAAKPMRQPAGAKLLIFCEMCERFSFFGMMGILALFLTAPATKGGFDWIEGRAVAFVGLYAGMVYLAGLGGGLAADKWLGPHRSVLFGGVIITAGHLILASPHALPLLAHVGSARIAFMLSYGSFYLGIAFLVVGTGLFKPNIAVLLGNLYGERDPRREAGFIYFYMGMNIGSVLAPLIVGSLGELVGWSYGFAAAGGGMLIAMLVFGYGARAPKDEHAPGGKRVADSEHAPGGGDRRTPRRQSAAAGLPRGSWLLGFILLVLGATVFWAGAEQMFGYLNLFVFNQTDRHIAAFEVPATWFQGLNPVYIILLAPLLGKLWQELQRRNRNPHIVWKFVVGLGILGLSFLVMRMAALRYGGTGKGSGMAWIAVTYLLETFSELILWVTGLAMVSRLAPSNYRGSAMGLWYTAMAMGNWLAGAIGEAATHVPASTAFGYMAALQFAAALFICLMARRMIRWLGE